MKRYITDYFRLIIGTIITALSFNLFLIPNKIAAGGVGGIGTIIYHISGFPVGVTMILLNIPLFIIGIRILGKHFGIKTIIATLLLSISIDVLKVPPITDDIFLSSIYGGIFVGLGLGLVFRSNATTGGTDLAARIIHRFVPFLSIGWILFVIDFCIVVAAGIIFDIYRALYAIISLFISTKAIDLVLEGFNDAKVFIIISSQGQKIAENIITKLDRGVTSLKGKGMFTEEEKDVLLCVVTRMEVGKLRDAISEIDVSAFVTISDAKEVMGEGFDNTIFY
ncbi:MAG: YitT family protein [Clostridia bacterium]|nr:YitT family protein [Clostridia bacterium]